MSKYAVIGNPIAHSKSPEIHTLFAKQTGEDVSYVAEKVEPAALTDFITRFFATGGAGLNVTLPHKENVFALVASSSERAARAKAVNTVFLDGTGELCGDNTDGVGLVRDILINHGFPIKGKRILLLGAGGAVRGTLAALLTEQPHSLCIANRTLAKAEQLQMEFADIASIQVMSLNALGGESGHEKTAADLAKSFDLIINGTSMGINDEAPQINPSVLAAGSCCYDMMYKNTDTAFVKWAKNNGAGMAHDGLGMLVEQAAEAFAIWRGVRPETAPVIAHLRDKSS